MSMIPFTQYPGNEAGVILLILGFPFYFIASILLGICSELFNIRYSSLRDFISHHRKIITVIITVYLFLLITTEIERNDYSLVIVDVVVFPILLLVAAASCILGLKLGRKITKALKR